MSTRLSLPVGERDHIGGSAEAPVTLLEYGDYECPHCRAAYPAVEAVRKAMGPQLQFVYRHFPLTNVHPHAQRAAEAAEAAGAQGRFWPMHDLLYADRHALDDRGLLLRAEEAGLDTVRFARDLSLGTFLPKVREDFMSGVRSGVNGTPTLFVNGVRHPGGYDAESLTAAVEDALVKA
jgi:protein-disulfide isomerase